MTLTNKTFFWLMVPVFIFCSQPVAAQQQEKNTGVTNIPCHFHRGHIYIETSISGRRGLWIIDSGAEISFIDKTFAAPLKLKPYDKIMLQGAYKTNEYPEVMLKNLQVRTLKINRLRALVVDLAGLFKHHDFDLPFAGVLGRDFLVNFITRIDYARERVSFLLHHTFKYEGKGTIIKGKIRNGLITIPLEVNGRYKGNWVVDVGADGSSFHYWYAFEHRILKKKGIRYMGRGLGGNAPGCISQFKWMELGGFRLERPIISFPLRNPTGAFGDTWTAGNLGNSVLCHFVVYIDYMEPRIILEKGKYFGQGFPLRLKGGMDVIITRNGRLKVHRLAPGAEWRRAGVCKGDLLQTMRGVNLKGFDGIGILAKTFKRKPTVHCLTITRDGQSMELICNFSNTPVPENQQSQQKRQSTNTSSNKQ